MMVANIHAWLESRRLGKEQSREEIGGFVRGVVSGEVSRQQAADWLALVMAGGMSAKETQYLTVAMMESGSKMEWDSALGPFWDKHSTGGVGDKVSLVLAPLWACLGIRVPMISGRGLGITGGTLDKLESIKGFSTALDEKQRIHCIREVGCFIQGQTLDIAPADRILYALRNETGTIASVPLITASILSKKLVEGIDRLVLDVKFGSGAFMKTKPEAYELAQSLESVGQLAGVETIVHLTDMSQPLGMAVGNALEVEEAIQCLHGDGPSDLEDLVVELSHFGESARRALRDDSALQKWQAMVTAQGGNPDAPLRGEGCATAVIEATHSGVVTQCDAEGLGRAAFTLGAGRATAEDEVHFGVGLKVHAKEGSQVEVGDPLVTLLHVEKGLASAREMIHASIQVN